MGLLVFSWFTEKIHIKCSLKRFIMLSGIKIADKVKYLAMQTFAERIFLCIDGCLHITCLHTRNHQ